MSEVKIGIVTVTYNSVSFLAEFEASIASQSHDNFVVYCIDNASADGTQEALGRITDPRWRIVLNERNTGVAEGNNQGIISAVSDGCDYVLLLNNDTTFAPGFLQEMLDGCAKNSARVVVPKIHFDEPRDAIWYGGGGFNPWRGQTGYHVGIGELDTGQFDVPNHVDYSPTCAMIVHRDVFVDVGLMDETYFVYFDDTDFCLRLKRRGVPVLYWPKATLIHKVGGSTGGRTSPFTVRMTSRNRLYYLRRHFGLGAALLWLPVFVAYYIALYGIVRPNMAALKASVSGTLEFYRLKPDVPDLHGGRPGALAVVS